MQAPCTNETAYGFREGTPCMLLKLNKVKKKDINKPSVAFKSVSLGILNDKDFFYNVPVQPFNNNLGATSFRLGLSE